MVSCRVPPSPNAEAIKYHRAGGESLDQMAEKDQGPGSDGWQDMVDAYRPMEL